MWNEVFLIRKYHPDQSVRDQSLILLDQINTDGGIIIDHEIETFINRYTRDIPPVNSRTDHTQLNIF